MTKNDLLKNLYTDQFKRDEMEDGLRRARLIPFIVGVIMAVVLLCVVLARAQETPQPEVDLAIIAKIESNNNPLAYNPISHARGMYQITPICLKEYNAWHPTSKIAYNALFSPVVAQTVAEWYLGIRIPQMLRFYNISDTLENRLFAYNAGIGKVIKNQMPIETKNYIKKYKQLMEKINA